MNWIIPTMLLLDVYVSNTENITDRCCEENHWHSIITLPGLYQIDYDNSLKFLWIWSQEPRKWWAKLSGNSTILEWTAPNMMFFTDRETLIRVAKLK